MASQRDLSALQQQIWAGSIPLEIRLASTECRTYDDSDPYLVDHHRTTLNTTAQMQCRTPTDRWPQIQVPRLSYIPFLLPRLHAFFAPALIEPDVDASRGWLTFDGVPLRWHHPLGLLYDLYSGAEPSNPDDDPPATATADPPTSPTSSSSAPASSPPLPWRLTAHFTTPAPPSLVPLDPAYKAHHDAFVNAVKEADFLRNGTAKAAMSLSKDASDRLWAAVRAGDLPAYNAVNGRMLLNPPGAGPLRHVPMKLYLPGAPVVAAAADEAGGGEQQGPVAAFLRVVQALVPPTLAGGGSGAPSARGGGGQPQTLGTALNGVLPSLFPSRRSPLLAQPVLHGAVVPLSAPVEELLRAAAYADGFLHVAIVMMG
ncbi:2-nitropropane dioxygenase NPD [Neofusicoccum parvum]|uniref:2-nitropropane dioxygenase NPD n=1 Tax=Neofusicoccum parvum TaxID=310453 RepID=A0ACB5SAD6_9PEZI|nr:2-nitropropane dioxygenase NPD [Neofusicoccum parvum]